PAPGAEVLADADGARAGCATDAGIELVVQSVVVELVQTDEVPHIAPGPFDQRADLDTLGLLNNLAHFCSRIGLFAAQAGDPAVMPGQRAGQRLHLADIAALFAQVDTL